MQARLNMTTPQAARIPAGCVRPGLSPASGQQICHRAKAGLRARPRRASPSRSRAAVAGPAGRQSLDVRVRTYRCGGSRGLGHRQTTPEAYLFPVSPASGNRMRTP
jgi:hypothetical protein